MFNFLKNKISEWTKKISEDKENSVREIKQTRKQEKKEKKPQVQKEEKKEFKFSKKKEGTKEEREVSEKVIEDIKIEVETKKSEEQDKQKEEEKKGFFTKFKEKFTTVKISEKEFEVYAEELEMLLLENNVALEVAEKIIQELKKQITEKDIPKKDIEKIINNSLKNIIEEILVEPFDILSEIKNKKEPYVILFCGINGTGKTTTIAKIANFLNKNKISCVIAAADTFRAASIEQIKTHGERLDVNVIAHEYGSDPASVGFDAISYAKKNGIKVVLIDTAGRMHTAKNLLKEIEKVAKVCKPDVKIFVGEATTGNDSVDQVKAFDETIGINGIILAKADTDEKGGTALSVGYVTKKPILFLGTGQEYDKLEPFDKKKFVEKLGL
jgi:fused signal recognition particle receptor